MLSLLLSGARSRPVLLVPTVLAAAAGTTGAQAPLFQDISDRLDFVHRTDGGEGLAGLAWLDHDGDGDLDLFLSNGIGHAPRLLANDGEGGFTDVTAAANLVFTSGSSGVVAGDLDNDGYPELLVLGEGGIMGAGQTPTRLFANRGDGSFEDVSAASGIVGPPSAMSAAFGDVDNDGLLDVFIAAPGSLASQVQHTNQLYRNEGGLSFTDISAGSGVDTDLGACALSFTDFDGDGYQDVLVANCNDVGLARTPHELFRNNGDLTFTEIGKQVGLTREGYWMSLSLGDVDNDGDLDLFSTNSGGKKDPHALYLNEGGRYRFRTAQAGLLKREFGWGSSLADFDNDGDLDLFFAGSLPPAPFNVIGPGLGNPGLLFENDGQSRFDLVPGGVPMDLSSRYTSGVAHADCDDDGFPDVVVATDSFTGTPDGPALLRSLPNGNHWITVQPVGTLSNRGGVGARIEVQTAGFAQVREIWAGSSFAASETPWPTFGLGPYTSARLVVTWPSGLVEVFACASVDRTVTIVEGTGG